MNYVSSAGRLFRQNCSVRGAWLGPMGLLPSLCFHDPRVLMIPQPQCCPTNVYGGKGDDVGSMGGSVQVMALPEC